MRAISNLALLLLVVLAAGGGLLDAGRADAQPIAGATHAGTHSGGGAFERAAI